MKIKKWFYAIMILALGLSFTACTNDEFDDDASGCSELQILNVTSQAIAVSATQNDLTIKMQLCQGAEAKAEKYGFCYTQDPELVPDMYNATTVIGDYTGFNEYSTERTVVTTLKDVKAESVYYVRGYVIEGETHKPVYTKVYKVEVGSPVYVAPEEETPAEVPAAE